MQHFYILKATATLLSGVRTTWNIEVNLASFWIIQIYDTPTKGEAPLVRCAALRRVFAIEQRIVRPTRTTLQLHLRYKRDDRRRSASLSFPNRLFSVDPLKRRVRWHNGLIEHVIKIYEKRHNAPQQTNGASP